MISSNFQKLLLRDNGFSSKKYFKQEEKEEEEEEEEETLFRQFRGVDAE